MVKSDILFYVESVIRRWILGFSSDNNTSISEVQVVQVYSEYVSQVSPRCTIIKNFKYFGPDVP